MIVVFLVNAKELGKKFGFEKLFRGCFPPPRRKSGTGPGRRAGLEDRRSANCDGLAGHDRRQGMGEGIMTAVSFQMNRGVYDFKASDVGTNGLRWVALNSD